jgi:hypothetical protein
MAGFAGAKGARALASGNVFEANKKALAGVPPGLFRERSRSRAYFIISALIRSSASTGG